MTFTWRRSIIRFAVTGITAGGVISSVSAQQFQFDKADYHAAPGEAVELKIMLADCPRSVAATHFTLRVSEEDAQKLYLDMAAGEKSSAVPTLFYAENAGIRRQTNEGVITGSVVEYRGAIYPITAQSSAFSATAPIHVATVRVPIELSASGRFVIELASGFDGDQPLAEAVDAQGNPMAPAGRNQPLGQVASVVLDSNRPMLDTDFAGRESSGFWKYTATLPDFAEVRPVGRFEPGKGLVIESYAVGSVGSWAYDSERLGAWRKPAAGQLYVTDWRVGSDVDGIKSPAVRLGVGTANGFLTYEWLFQDLAFRGKDERYSLAPGTRGTTYRTIVPVPAFTADGNARDGIDLVFGLQQYDGQGATGHSIWLGHLTERFVDPNTLTKPKTEYHKVFSSKQSGEWQHVRNDYGGKPVSYEITDQGLGVQSIGPLEKNADGFDVYSFGSWYTPKGTLSLAANSDRWYRIEAGTIGTAENPPWNPNIRVRIHTVDNEFSAQVTLVPSVDPRDVTLPRPGWSEKTLETWFVPPREIDRQELRLAFDMMHLHAPGNDTNQTPAAFLKQIKVTSYEAPDLE